MTDIRSDEFSFLAEEAQVQGIQGELPSVQRQHVTVEGRRLSALRWGEGAPSLTLLHGAGLNAHTWDATLLALRQPALALDLPGHGDSGWRDDADYRPESLADAVSDATRHWTTRPQTLVGQSLGGLTAAVVASRHPDLVRRLVIIDITPGLTAAPGESNPVREFLSGPKDFASRDEIVDRALRFGFGPDRAAVERGVALNTRRNDHGRFMLKHHLANLAEGQQILPSEFGRLWPLLEQLEIPVLLIYGQQGFLRPADIQEFLDRVPRASAAGLPTGHNVQEDAPVALAQVLNQVLVETS